MRISKVSLWTAQDDNDDDVQVIYQSPPDCQLIGERIVNPPAPVASKGSSSRTSVITGSRKRHLAPRKDLAVKRLALQEVDLNEDSSNEIVEIGAESPAQPSALMELGESVTGNYSIWENVLNPDSILTEVRIDNPVFVSAHNVGGKRIENYAVFENEHNNLGSSTPPNQRTTAEHENETVVCLPENISSNPQENTPEEAFQTDRHPIRNELNLSGEIVTNQDTVIRHPLRDPPLVLFNHQEGLSDVESLPESLHSSENEDSSDEYSIQWEAGEDNYLRPRVVSNGDSSVSFSIQHEETFEEVDSPSPPAGVSEDSSESFSIQREEPFEENNSPNQTAGVSEDSCESLSIQHEEPFEEDDSPNQPSGIDEDSSESFSIQQEEPFEDDSPSQPSGIIEDSSESSSIQREEAFVEGISSSQPAAIHEDSSELFGTFEDNSLSQPAFRNEDAVELCIHHMETILENRLPSRQHIYRIRERENEDSSLTIVFQRERDTYLASSNPQASLNEDSSELLSIPEEETPEEGNSSQQASVHEDSSESSAIESEETLVDLESSVGHDISDILEVTAPSPEASENGDTTEPPLSFHLNQEEVTLTQVIQQATGNSEFLPDQSVNMPHSSNQQDPETQPWVVVPSLLKVLWRGSIICEKTVRGRTVTVTSPMQCNIFGVKSASGNINLTADSWSAQMKMLILPLPILSKCGLYEDIKRIRDLSLVYFSKTTQFMKLLPTTRKMQWIGAIRFPSSCPLNMMFVIPIKSRKQPFLFGGFAFNYLQGGLFDKFVRACQEYHQDQQREEHLLPSTSAVVSETLSSPLFTTLFQAQDSCSRTTWPPPCSEFAVNFPKVLLQPTSLFQRRHQQTNLLYPRHLRVPVRTLHTSQGLNLSLPPSQQTSLPQACPLNLQTKSQNLSQQTSISQPSSQQARFLQQVSQQSRSILPPSSQQTSLPEPSSQQASLPEPSSQQAILPQPSSQQASLPQPSSQQASLPQPSSQQASLPQPSSPQASLSHSLGGQQASLPEPSSQQSNLPEALNSPIRVPQPSYQPAPLSQTSTLQQQMRSFIEGQQTSLPIPSTQISTLPEPTLFQPSFLETNQQTGLSSGFPAVFERNLHVKKRYLPSSQELALRCYRSIKESNQLTSVSQPSNQQTVLQQPSSQETVLQQPSSQQTVLQQPSSQQTCLSQPLGLQLISPAVNPLQLLERAYLPSTSQANIPQCPGQQTGLLQPSSQQSNLPQQFLHLESWPRSSNLPTDSMRTGVGLGSRWTGQPLSSPQTFPLQQQASLYQTSNIQTSLSQTSGQQTNLLQPSSLQTSSTQTSQQLSSLPGQSNQLTDSMGYGTGIGPCWTSQQQSSPRTCPSLQTTSFQLPNLQTSLSQTSGQQTNIIQPLNQLSSLPGSSNQLRGSMGHGIGPRWTGQPLISPQTLPLQQQSSVFQTTNPQTNLYQPSGQQAMQQQASAFQTTNPQTNLSQPPDQQASIVQPPNLDALRTGIADRFFNLWRRTPLATRRLIQQVVSPQNHAVEYQSADQHIDAILSNLHQQNRSPPSSGPSTSQSQQPGTSRMDHDYSLVGCTAPQLIESKACEVFPNWLVKKVMQKKSFKSADELCDVILALTEDERNAMREAKSEVSEALLCKVCLDEQFNMLFEPCGHVATCMECAKCLQKCPICRCFITKKRRIYMS